jgi:hypothetical protein
MEGHRLSRRGLDAGRDPLAAVPLEALVGRAPEAPAMQPGARRNTRHRNKRQRGEQSQPRAGTLSPVPPLPMGLTCGLDISLGGQESDPELRPRFCIPG